LAGRRHVQKVSVIVTTVLQRLACTATSQAGNWTAVIKPWYHNGYDLRRRVFD
jgi:hypothetical protein